MRVFVKVCCSGGGEPQAYALPCNEPTARVGSLKSLALDRWSENRGDNSKRDAEGFQANAVGYRRPLVRQRHDSGRSARRRISGPLDIFQALTGIENKEAIELDGLSLSVENLMRIGRGELKVKISESAVNRVKRSRKVVDDLVASDEVTYGVTTGFGKFASVVIPKEKTIELQENLIRSHAAGVGPPLSPEQTRRLLALRLNVLVKGYSGARLETVQKLEAALNASCLPLVPEQGTVGASGDLAPLSHLALGLMGEGLMWSPSSGWANAADVLEAHGLSPLSLQAKEGISLINGTQLITGLGVEALSRAELIAKQADVVAALTLDVLQGTPRAFDYDVHANRPHYGQQMVAGRLRALLDSSIHHSEIRASHKNCHRVQDPYTLRCIPQVHGVVNDTLTFVRGILTTEMNSALDNPVMDYLAIAVHELANISERRQERLMNPSISAGSGAGEGEVKLPAFLASDGGINSGFMIAHCTSAALVSENKVLTHPSSVDSISTSAAQEDHVSMGGFAARKAISVVSHVEQVLAIELLAACQALEFHRPRTTTPPLEEVHKLVRTVVRPWDKDRFMSPDIEAATKLLREGRVWTAAEPHISHYKTTANEPPPKRIKLVHQS
ncbi:Histidine ammonia-lyase [Geodia barretti]|uniref:Histidine ammonia-lyase n=1 Tax=Geodia barretti TaxID=519541 RepID=A0AA35SM62_GEOBA|nr:Histidine ammonia-lyase [Geodia barretti]